MKNEGAGLFISPLWNTFKLEILNQNSLFCKSQAVEHQDLA